VYVDYDHGRAGRTPPALLTTRGAGETEYIERTGRITGTDPEQAASSWIHQGPVAITLGGRSLHAVAAITEDPLTRTRIVCAAFLDAVRPAVTLAFQPNLADLLDQRTPWKGP